MDEAKAMDEARGEARGVEARGVEAIEATGLASVPIERLSENGCLVDSWFGQFSIGAMFAVADNLGYRPDPSDERTFEVERSAGVNLERPDGLSDAYHERVTDLADQVERWLDEVAADEGHRVFWFDGNLMVGWLCDADDASECPYDEGICAHELMD